MVTAARRRELSVTQMNSDSAPVSIIRTCTARSGRSTSRRPKLRVRLLALRIWSVDENTVQGPDFYSIRDRSYENAV